MMDASVIRGMAKWPHVPAVFGWLSLDERGQWRLRGVPIRNPRSVGFINRNYGADVRGRWFFQNGPQRVFLTLAYTPWIFHLNAEGRLETHTGLPVADLRQVYLDEEGIPILVCEHGAGRLLDTDLPAILDRFTDATVLEQTLAHFQPGRVKGLGFRWDDRIFPVTALPRAEVPAVLGFIQRPEPDEVKP